MFGTSKLQAKVEGFTTFVFGAMLFVIVLGDPDIIRDCIKFIQKLPRGGKIGIMILAFSLIWIGLKD